MKASSQIGNLSGVFIVFGRVSVEGNQLGIQKNGFWIQLKYMSKRPRWIRLPPRGHKLGTTLLSHNSLFQIVGIISVKSLLFFIFFVNFLRGPKDLRKSWSRRDFLKPEQLDSWSRAMFSGPRHMQHGQETHSMAERHIPWRRGSYMAER